MISGHGAHGIRTWRSWYPDMARMVSGLGAHGIRTWLSHMVQSRFFIHRGVHECMGLSYFEKYDAYFTHLTCTLLFIQLYIMAKHRRTCTLEQTYFEKCQISPMKNALDIQTWRRGYEDACAEDIRIHATDILKWGCGYRTWR